MGTRIRSALALLVGVCVASGCRDAATPADTDDPGGTGDGADGVDDDEGEDGDESGDPEPDEPEPERVGLNGLRRLTIHEYDASLQLLLGDDTAPGRTFLPEDPRVPFDNDATEQVPSSALVDGAEALALDVAGRLVEDSTRRVDVVGCTPAAPDDEACLRPFVERLGRLALRRPLAAAEVDAFLALQAIGLQGDDPWLTVETIVAALLQHPEFVYRVELGQPTDVEGVFRLDAYETVSRLSFFLLGTTPSETLLDAAQAVDVDERTFTSDERRELAAQILADAGARAQVDRFHALWLNYEVLPHDPALSEPMRAETRALVERVAFDEQEAYAELFRAGETFVTAELADHYELPAPEDPAGDWVAYGDTGRRGLLSHGSFLSNGGAFGDTSPTIRGLTIKERLLCSAIPSPPDNVNADDQPEGDGCKWDRLSPYRDPDCIVCHGQFDPYGWALEAYDAQGRYRSVDEAGCDLEPYTEVEIPELGTLRGPGELGELVAESDLLRNCVATQLYRFAFGKTELLDEDRAFVEALLEQRDPGFSWHDLVLDVVTDEAFGFRKETTP